MNRKSFLSTLVMAIVALFVPSPTLDKTNLLIGEVTGTTRSNPEVIAPLDHLRQKLNVKVTGKIRGSDMKKIEIKGSLPLEYFKAKNPANKLKYKEYIIKKDRLN